MPDRPTFAPIWLRCGHCAHQWDDWQPERAPFRTWIAHCKTYRCPRCGTGPRRLFMRSSPLEFVDVGALADA